LSSVSNQTLTPSLPSSETGKSLMVLCSMKSQAQFTPHQLATWAAVLGLYPTETVNRAVLTIGLSVDPFPDLAKVVASCQAIEAEKNPQVVRGEQTAGKPSIAIVDAAATALGLKV